MIRAFLAIALLFPSVALAQPGDVSSPSQLAVQIDNAVGVLSQRAEYAEAQLRAARQQLEALNKELEARNKELEALKPKPTELKD